MPVLDAFRARMQRIVARRLASPGEAREAEAFFDALAEREHRGEISHAEAMAEVDRFGRAQMRRRRIS
jgi:hypothetical protein